jgi:hypothetical protein
MGSDESDFDKLLKEAREWEARDRARHRSFAVEGDGEARPPAAGPQAPRSAAEAHAKGADAMPGRGAFMKPAPRERVQTITEALRAAMARTQAQAQANPRKRGGGWGWIWVLVVLYFLFRRYLH